VEGPDPSVRVFQKGVTKGWLFFAEREKGMTRGVGETRGGHGGPKGKQGIGNGGEGRRKDEKGECEGKEEDREAGCDEGKKRRPKKTHQGNKHLKETHFQKKRWGGGSSNREIQKSERVITEKGLKETATSNGTKGG